VNLASLRTRHALALAFTLAAVPATAQVQFLGVGAIPGDAQDNSGLTGLLEDGVTPRNQIGGLGSALAYTGFGEFYIGTPDRGPADGATTYPDRVYLVRIDVRPSLTNPGQFVVNPQVWDTRLLRNEKGQRLIGSFAAFDATNSPASRRFDPEGVRAAGCGGNFWVSDEYGPFLYEFGPDGKRRRSLALPNKFLIDFPSVNPTDELGKNAFGRQANRGMEGLAISPDGSKLYGLMQSPLIQDGGLSPTLSRVGTNARLLEIDVATGAFRELLYVLDGASNGLSEILAVNDHQFLVLERDGRVGAAAQFKKVFLIDITDATDIRALKQLPSTVPLPVDVTPVAKSPFLDMLDPAFGLAGAGFPEKIEGLAFGPDLPDGRHLLVISHDNDFLAAQSSKFFVFAVDPASLPGFVPQEVRLTSCHARREE
jgi:hypothetical protein